MPIPNIRPVAAIVVSVLAAAVSYVALAAGDVSSSTPDAWEAPLMLLLPAVLMGLLYAAFVLLPLWSLFTVAGPRRRLAFVAAGGVIWVLVCAGLIASRHFQVSGIDGATPLLIPGLVLVLMFALLAQERSAEPSV